MVATINIPAAMSELVNEPCDLLEAILSSVYLRVVVTLVDDADSLPDPIGIVALHAMSSQMQATFEPDGSAHNQESVLSLAVLHVTMDRAEVGTGLRLERLAANASAGEVEVVSMASTRGSEPPSTGSTGGPIAGSATPDSIAGPSQPFDPITGTPIPGPFLLDMRSVKPDDLSSITIPRLRWAADSAAVRPIAAKSSTARGISLKFLNNSTATACGQSGSNGGECQWGDVARLPAVFPHAQYGTCIDIIEGIPSVDQKCNLDVNQIYELLPLQQPTQSALEGAVWKGWRGVYWADRNDPTVPRSAFDGNLGDLQGVLLAVESTTSN